MKVEGLEVVFTAYCDTTTAGELSFIADYDFSSSQPFFMSFAEHNEQIYSFDLKDLGSD